MDPVKVEAVPTDVVPVKQVTDEQYSLNWRDLGKGALVAVGTAVLTAIYDGIQTGSFSDIKWGAVGVIAVSTLITYLLKNFLTPTQTIRVYKKAA